jgi:beta-glucosidase
MWGTGASSTQCEGAAPASDWLEWERTGRAPVSGDGNNFATRYAEDFALYSTLGLKHHRLSIEWSRIEPEHGQHDRASIDHYRRVLTRARDMGIEPWVCLHHFTLPRWFADGGGFLVEANRVGAWARHVDFIADEFGDLVTGWQPVNEPNLYPALAYRGGGWPPGRNNEGDWALAMEGIQLATAEAAVRLRQTGAPVASIFGLSTAEPLDSGEPTRRAIERYYERNWNSGLGLFRDGVLRVPGRTPVERPDLAGSFDLIGFSYYSALGMRDGQATGYPPDAPTSPLGYTVWADGLRLVFDRLHAEVPSAPLLVAEYGVGTRDDLKRAAYLQRGIDITADAIRRGIDVRGFFHWTGVDNYEWLHGNDVSFGIIDRHRAVRPSAQVLRDEATRR